MFITNKLFDIYYRDFCTHFWFFKCIFFFVKKYLMDFSVYFHCNTEKKKKAHVVLRTAIRS